MKAEELLRRYAAGERDFHRVSLQGQSFKGKDLSGANFSEADIRGANFTNAKLTGANFSSARAGLQRRWAIVLLIVALFLSALSGFVLAFAGVWTTYLLKSEILNKFTLIPGVIVLLAFVVLFFITIQKGLATALQAGAGILAVAGTTAVGIAVALAGAGTLAVAVAGNGSLALAGALAGTLAGTLSIAIALAVGGAVAGYVSVILALALALALGLALGARAVDAAVAVNLALLGALVGGSGGILLSRYIAWQALVGSEKHSFVRNIAVAVAAMRSTRFYGANLTNANFTQAILKNTDLRGAILTHTCWHQAKKLDRVRPGNSYLQFPKVQQLLITGQGQAQKFDRQLLRGVNLQGANLADASFIGTDLSEANLQDADLSRAKLVQTQLDKANLTGTTLTGATIEDWGITSHTKLDGVRCEYVFMREPTKEDPNPHRKPDNWAEFFKDGDFADFIKPIVDTLDLYHNQDVDPRTIAISFKQLAENHPEAELEIVAMEKRGIDKLLLKAKTAPDADRSELSAEYFSTYNQLKALANCEFKALIAEKDSRIRSLENMVETALERHSFYSSIQIQEVGNMASNPGGFSVGGSVGGDIRNLQGDNNRAIQGDNNQGVLGDNNQVTQGQGAATAEEQLTKADVIALLTELDKLVREAELPEDTKEEATLYLGAAKKATEKEEPKKETALTNLQTVAETLETASKTVNAGTNIWGKAKPIIIKVASWLGAAAGSYLLGL